MKIKGKTFYTALFGLAVAIPVVGHSVTLPSSSRTPCLFGALGNPSACAARQAGDMAPMARVVTPPPVPEAQVPETQAASTVQVSNIVAQTEVQEVLPKQPQITAVPLPLASGLLLGSLGLMLFSVRRRK